ncbi:hypothetical protein C2E23DRAFT_580209 [Lenzites betulinus]|nr:hypothetical protein C2E23DRAFT_580209 [Lenzites betulinus]
MHCSPPRTAYRRWDQKGSQRRARTARPGQGTAGGPPSGSPCIQMGAKEVGSSKVQGKEEGEEGDGSQQRRVLRRSSRGLARIPGGDERSADGWRSRRLERMGKTRRLMVVRICIGQRREMGDGMVHCNTDAAQTFARCGAHGQLRRCVVPEDWVAGLGVLGSDGASSEKRDPNALGVRIDGDGVRVDREGEEGGRGLCWGRVRGRRWIRHGRVGVAGTDGMRASSKADLPVRARISCWTRRQGVMGQE